MDEAIKADEPQTTETSQIIQHTQTIDFHLKQALAHLETAIDQSISLVLNNENAKKPIGLQWEGFLGEFISQVREKGKRSRINILSWISFPRIR